MVTAFICFLLEFYKVPHHTLLHLGLLIRGIVMHLERVCGRN